MRRCYSQFIILFSYFPVLLPRARTLLFTLSLRFKHLKAMRWLSFNALLLAATAAAVVVVIHEAIGVASVTLPTSNCYALDNSSRIVDFSHLIGKSYEYSFDYEGQDTDLVVEFCKDVETRSQTGYRGFGRFDGLSYFVTGYGHVDYVQRFYNGDLANCELTYDKLGRTAQVNLVCGSCSNGRCKGGLGCICNITLESTCRVFVELAIPCEKPGLRVFEGFTVGFHPRSWEVVYNGMTIPGYEKAHRDFSFSTEQTHVTLYMTAVASRSSLVQKPIVKVSPQKGLEVMLSGSGVTGSPPTTLSPSTLNVYWICQEVRDKPYEVNVTVPVDGYEPVQFFLAKMCEYRQDQEEESFRGWAVFGILSCVFIVISTLFCTGGFIYKSRVERLRGIDALPGMTILSACLDSASSTMNSGYAPAENLSSGYASDASWDRSSASAQRAWRPSDRKYGAI